MAKGKKDEAAPGGAPDFAGDDFAGATLEELETAAEEKIAALLSEEEEGAILAAVHGALDSKLSPGMIHVPIAATSGVVDSLVARAMRRKVALMVLKAARFNPSSLSGEGASRADTGAGGI